MTDAREPTRPPDGDARHDTSRRTATPPGVDAPEAAVAPPVDVAPELHDNADE